MAHRDMARLEDRADFHGERLAALVALVRTDPSALATHLPDSIAVLAARANRSIGPNLSLNEGVSGSFVMKAFLVKSSVRHLRVFLR
jgi:hypothetical protein